MVVTGEVFGIEPVFMVSEYILRKPVDILYIPLGVTFGFLSILWTRTLYFVEGLFERLAMKRVLKPAFGGLLTGLIGVFLLRYGILGFGMRG